MVAALPACRYLPVQDAELPACHYLPLRTQKNLPVQYAELPVCHYLPFKDSELPACPRCAITCLPGMRNYLPV